MCNFLMLFKVVNDISLKQNLIIISDVIIIFTVEVTVRGPINESTGMVMNLTELKDCIQKVVMDQMDHKNIDKQVDYFTNTVSTTENIAVYVFKELQKYMSKPELLYEVKIHETDKNVMCFKGEYLE